MQEKKPQQKIKPKDWRDSWETSQEEEAEAVAKQVRS